MQSSDLERLVMMKLIKGLGFAVSLYRLSNIPYFWSICQQKNFQAFPSFRIEINNVVVI